MIPNVNSQQPAGHTMDEKHMKVISLPYRISHMKSLANSKMMDFKLLAEFDHKHFLKDFFLFRKNLGIINCILSKDLPEFNKLYIFDFHHTRSFPFDSITTVFFYHSKDLILPEFYMRPESFFDKLGSVLGGDDIDFEEYPVFSDAYFLKGENESYIRKIFDKKLLKMFTIQKNWTLEGLGYNFLFYKKNKELHSDQVDEMLGKGRLIYEKLISKSNQ